MLERLARQPGLALGTDAAHRIRALMPQLKERAKTLAELADAAGFLAHPLPLPMEPKAAALLTAENRLMLREVAAALAATDFSAAGWTPRCAAMPSGPGANWEPSRSRCGRR